MRGKYSFALSFEFRPLHALYIYTRFWLLARFTTDITSTLPRDITNGEY